jgi:hypothetical protein
VVKLKSTFVVRYQIYGVSEQKKMGKKDVYDFGFQLTMPSNFSVMKSKAFPPVNSLPSIEGVDGGQKQLTWDFLPVRKGKALTLSFLLKNDWGLKTHGGCIDPAQAQQEIAAQAYLVDSLRGHYCSKPFPDIEVSSVASVFIPRSSSLGTCANKDDIYLSYAQVILKQSQSCKEIMKNKAQK